MAASVVLLVFPKEFRAKTGVTVSNNRRVTRGGGGMIYKEN